MNSREEKAFWEARRELRHVRDYARARRAAPWAALGVTLARVVAATPHEWQLPGDGSLNLFVGLVGASGTGKGKATRASRRAVRMADVKVVPVGSGEGIAHQLAYYEKPTKETAGGVVRTNYNLLIDIPEIDTMASIGGRSGSTLFPELRKAWSGEPLGMAYANREKALVIDEHEYRISLVAGIQPRRAGALLNDSDGGTPQRFVWMPVGDPGAPEVRPEAPDPLQWTTPRPSRRTLGVVEISVCRAALRELDAHELKTTRGEIEPSHAMFGRLKVAAALGLFNGRISVSEEDWQLSELITAKSVETRAEVESQLDEAQLDEARDRGRKAHASNEAFQDIEHNVERVSKKMLEKLAGKRDGMAGNELRSAIAYRDRVPWFQKALDRLMSQGLVGKEHVDTGFVYHKTKAK